MPGSGLRSMALVMTGAFLVAAGAAVAQDSAAEHCAAPRKPSPFVRSHREYSLPAVTLRDQADRAALA